MNVIKTINGNLIAASETLSMISLCEKHKADLSRANLRGANLSRANLSGADLWKANLSEADLSRANLSEANLSGADLWKSNLWGADLWKSNLSEASLWKSNLSEANLSGANLSEAYLSEAKTDESTKWSKFQIPQEGTLTVWKKLSEGLVAKLLIPASSPRTASLVGRKCRAQRAKVLAIFEGSKRVEEGRSMHDSSFFYYVGKYVEAPDYNDDPKVECTQGIHFFLNLDEAEAY